MDGRLAPVNSSDQPVLANYATVNVAPGMAFIDFGFLKPGLLAALPACRKVRVGKFRVIYRVNAARQIDLIACGSRERIFEETHRLIAADDSEI